MITDNRPALRCLSLGWGVQSFTLAAMSALGELPKLDMVIHADTTWERKDTYEFAEEYTPWLEAHGIPVYSACSMSARAIEQPDNKTNFMPAYFEGRKEVVQVKRQCTERWKIRIVRELIKQELTSRGIKPSAGVVELWLGISWDEASRSASSQVQYAENRFPFLEKQTRMTRMDCITWLNKKEFRLPKKSACTQCSFHNQESWMEQKRNYPEDWAQSVYYDKLLSATPTKIKGERIKLFVHRSGKPLDQSVFLPEEQGYSQTFLPIDGPGCNTAGYCWD